MRGYLHAGALLDQTVEPGDFIIATDIRKPFAGVAEEVVVVARLRIITHGSVADIKPYRHAVFA